MPVGHSEGEIVPSAEQLQEIKTTIVRVKLCPRCLTRYFTPYGEYYIESISPPFPALSRRDNATMICSDCGAEEALEDVKVMGVWAGHKYWKE